MLRPWEDTSDNTVLKLREIKTMILYILKLEHIHIKYMKISNRVK